MRDRKVRDLSCLENQKLLDNQGEGKEEPAGKAGGKRIKSAGGVAGHKRGSGRGGENKEEKELRQTGGDGKRFGK